MSFHEKCDESDVVLDVDGVKFYCQRDKLAKQSPYFEAMFSDNFVEKHQDVIKIQGVDAAAMRFVLQWIDDTSQIDSLRGEEVLVVLQAAAMLQFASLQHTCEEVMVQRWLSSESCLMTAVTADQLSLTKLNHKASALAFSHFSEVRHTEAFLDLPLDVLVRYLLHDALSLGSSEDEFQVFEGISCWLEHKIIERKPDTLKALSCVRMRYISVSDIQSMLHYACINNCKDSQLLLKCIICIKEGREVATTEEKAVPVSEETPVILEGRNHCCETFKKLADHIIACSSEAPSEVNPVVEMEAVTSNEFSRETLLLARSILALPKRQLPTVACIIGHYLKKEKKTGLDEENSSPAYGLAKKNRKEKSKNGAPYIFYWNSNKCEQPIPLLPLTKIDEGPTEAVGYTVLSRGQELYVIGGEYVLGYGDWNKSIWKYNVWSETWTFETSLAVPRRHHFVVCLDNDMYVMGGCGKFRVIMDSVDCYNFTTKEWHKCAPLPTSLYSAAACVHNNLIYVISCQVFCYYPTSNNWVTLNDVDIPAGASFNTAMPFGKYMYLTGLYSADLMCFDPIGEKAIKRIGSFQNPAGNACLVGDKIYSFTEHNESPCVEMYDIKSDKFSTLWKRTPSDGKISFKKLGACFPLVLFETLWHDLKHP